MGMKRESLYTFIGADGINNRVDGKFCIYSCILNNLRQYELNTRQFDQNRHSDWFFINLFLN
jgi:hypothetical protein